MPYLHPSMSDTELLRHTDGLQSQAVHLLRQRLQDRANQTREARDLLATLPATIHRGDLAAALATIDRLRDLTSASAPGYPATVERN